MRKMMNKKGFSLVELMIVVVIMGILIAVAIPLYGAITDNANAKTCGSNIKTIRNAVTNYYASNDQTPIPSLAVLATMTQDKAVPVCPLGEEAEDGTVPQYSIYKSSDGQCQVYCPNYADHEDKAESTGSIATDAAPTASGTETWTKLS